MTETERLTRELAKYAFAKKGARQSPTSIAPDVLDYPHCELPGCWGEFFEVEYRGEDDSVALKINGDTACFSVGFHPAVC